jgi:hypothetical protein
MVQWGNVHLLDGWVAPRIVDRTGVDLGDSHGGAGWVEKKKVVRVMEAFTLSL